MKEKIKYFIAGIFIGLSELLPGISGATVALMFGVYEKILTFLSKFKEFSLMIPLLLGMILSVFAFSKIIDFELYENHANEFNTFIAILMIGYGTYLVINTYLKEDISKGKSFYLNLLLAILFGILLSVFNVSDSQGQEPHSFMLLVFGFIACLFLLFPGISGSAFLVYVGAHSVVIGSIASLDFSILLPFGVGMLISLAIMPRLINKAYTKYGKSILVFFGGLIFTAGINNFL
jgi:putative membrane protein